MFSWVLLITCLAGISLTLFWSWYFGNWRKHSLPIIITYTFSCVLSSFLILNLPVDIISAYHDFCLEIKSPHNCTQPFLYVDKANFWYFWNFVYWTTLVLTWTLLPFLKSFVALGDFTLKGRIKSAIFDNLIYYGTFLLISVVVLIYLLSKKTIEMKANSFKTMIITTSNTWGLFLVICFMGYGLVNFPRSLWHKSNPMHSLRKCLFKLSQLNLEIYERKDDFNFTVSEITYLRSHIPIDETLGRYSNIILRNLENHRHLLDQDVIIPETEFCITEKKLISLNKTLNKKATKYHRTISLFSNTLLNAAYHQDVVNSINSKKGTFLQENRPALPTMIRISHNQRELLPPKMQYIWHCYLKLYLFKILAVLSILFSLCTVWSECLFFIKSPRLSIPAALFEVMIGIHRNILVIITGFCSIGYIGICVLYSVYQLRIFGYYRLLKNHLSDEVSLLFCATLVSRLIPALCLNFLGLAHLDYHVIRSGESKHPETSFTRFMGHLDVIPFISKGFNIYFPIIVVLLCLVSYLRLGARIMRLFGVPQMLVTDEALGDGDETTNEIDQIIMDAIEDGKLILNRARMESKYQSQY